MPEDEQFYGKNGNWSFVFIQYSVSHSLDILVSFGVVVFKNNFLCTLEEKLEVCIIWHAGTDMNHDNLLLMTWFLRGGLKAAAIQMFPLFLFMEMYSLYLTKSNSIWVKVKIVFPKYQICLYYVFGLQL